jgi:hypothetical protein
VYCLSCDAERVTDLLPRPTLRSRHGHVTCFNTLSEPAQRECRAQPQSRVVTTNCDSDVVNVHDVNLS